MEAHNLSKGGCLMKGKVALIAAVAVLLSLCTAALATEYFVATNGNDTWPGTITQPWLTLDKANYTVAAGDTVNVRAGTYGSSDELRPRADGAPGAPITYRSYDGNLAAKLTGGMNVMGHSYATIIGFDSTSTSGMGIHIQPGNSKTLLPRSQYITVQNCWFHDPVRYDTVKLNQSDYLTFTDCEMSGPSGDEELDAVWVNYVTFTRTFIHDYDTIGVTFKGGSHYPIFEDGVVVHAIADGTKATRFGGSTDARYRDPDSLYASQYAVYRNNVIKDCRAPAAGDYECWYAYFYNNTVVDCGSSLGIIAHHADPKYSGDGGSRHVYWFNNAFLDNAGDMIEVYHNQSSLPAEDWLHDYNNFWNNGNPIPSGLWAGHDPNQEAHSTFGNPNLANQTGSATTYAGWKDCFRITSASTSLIDKGTSAAGNTPQPAVLHDIDGTARPQGAGWDIGAFEYVGGPVPPVADFVGNPTSGYAPLTVAFTDLSTGNPTSWSWAFGDGGTSAAKNPSHQYTAVNTYTVSLTATNAQGSNTKTKPNYITVSQQPTTSCHVGSIALVGKYKGTGTPSGRGYYAEATITAHDQACAVLEGVTVNITWSGCVSGTDSGTTNASGQVVFTSPVNPSGGTFTCTVTNLTKSGYPYQSGANHETSKTIQNP